MPKPLNRKQPASRAKRNGQVLKKPRGSAKRTSLAKPPPYPPEKAACHWLSQCQPPTPRVKFFWPAAGVKA